MKHLFRGQESKKRLELLLKLTDIRKPAYIDAIHDHLEADSKRSLPAVRAARKHGIEPSNFSRSLAALNKVANIHEQLKELELI